MTVRSISSILSLIAHIVVFFWQYLLLLQRTNPSLAFEEQISLWGTFFIRTLIIVVVVQIILSIVVHIIVQMIVRENLDAQDERDQLFELRSVRNFLIVFTFGFFTGMALLAMGQPIHMMFQAFAMTYLLAGMTNYLSFVFYYERGY